MLKILKFIFLSLGALLLVWAFKSADLTSVLSLLRRLGAGFLLVFAVYMLVTVADTVAWQYAFQPQDIAGAGFWRLWRIRQIGEAFNLLTPFGTMGGEPVKAHLLKAHHAIGLKKTIASLVVNRTANLLSLIIFMLIGMALSHFAAALPAAFKLTCLIGFLALSTGVYLFVLFQIRGGLNTVAGWFSRFAFAAAVKEALSKLEMLSRHMAEFYREYPERCGYSAGYIFLGWVIGIVELCLTLYFLGFAVSIKDAWIMEAAAQLLRAASFLIPLGIGAQEGGLILIFVSMGMTADVGLAVSLVRRIKELLWAGAGLAMGWGMSVKPEETEALEEI